MAPRHNPQPIPGYDPHRDNFWTQNSAAILRFIGGGDVDVMGDDGKWARYAIGSPTVPMGTHGFQARTGGKVDSGMSIFGRRKCRPAERPSGV